MFLFKIWMHENHSNFSPTGWKLLSSLRVLRIEPFSQGLAKFRTKNVMAASETQQAKKPYIHDKTPFVQKHVVGPATVKLKYSDLAKNFAPKTAAIKVGDYVADISIAGCSGKCTRIGKHPRSKKKGLFVTIHKALKNKKNKLSKKDVCFKPHDLKSFIRNTQSKQWYMMQAYKAGHAVCSQVFEIPGLNYDDPLEVDLNEPKTTTATPTAAAEKQKDAGNAKDTTAKPNAAVEKPNAAVEKPKATAETQKGDETERPAKTKQVAAAAAVVADAVVDPKKTQSPAATKAVDAILRTVDPKNTPTKSKPKEKKQQKIYSPNSKWCSCNCIIFNSKITVCN